MISVEGYRAFRGTMLIKCVNGQNYKITSDWLYKPECGCWYGNGESFMEESCEIMEDETK